MHVHAEWNPPEIPMRVYLQLCVLDFGLDMVALLAGSRLPASVAAAAQVWRLHIFT